MSKLFLYTLLGLLFSFNQQKMEIKTLKKSYTINDKITFSINNQDSIEKYILVELEKYEDNGTWALYWPDIFSKTSQALELTLVLKGESSKDFSFNIMEPDLLDSPKYSKRKNKEIKEKAKTGLFRLNLHYGNNEFIKNKQVYSNTFNIIKETN